MYTCICLYSYKHSLYLYLFMESDAPGPQELVEGMTGRGRVVQEGSVSRSEETPTVFV